jgi:hypothetical protein
MFLLINVHRISKVTGPPTQDVFIKRRQQQVEKRECFHFRYWKDALVVNGNALNQASFEVLTAANLKMAVVWVVATCSLVQVRRCFRGASTGLHGGTTQQAVILALNRIGAACRGHPLAVIFANFLHAAYTCNGNTAVRLLPIEKH